MAGVKLEDGLLHVEQVQEPSMIFLEKVHNSSFLDEMSISQLVTIWNAVCRSMAANLAKGKGTRLDLFGTLTLDQQGNPCFFPDPAFFKRFGLTAHVKPMRGSNVISGLAFTVVNHLAGGGLTRARITKVVSAVIETIHVNLMHMVPSMVVHLASMGEFVIGLGHVGVRFSPSFKAQLKERLRSAKRAPTTSSLLDQAERRRQAELRRAQFSKGLARPSSRASSRSSESDSGSALGRSRPAAADGGPAGRGGSSRSNAPARGRANDAFEDVGLKHIQSIKNKLTSRHGLHGLRSCRSSLSVIDTDGNGELTRDELATGLRNLGVKPDKAALEAVVRSLDADNSGTVTIEEFYLGLRGSMNVMRTKLVDRAFEFVRMSDQGRKGYEISVEHLRKTFNPDWHPDVKAGSMMGGTWRDVFIAMIDSTLVAPRNGFISLAKWVDYYQDISGTIEDDDYFAFVVRSSWNFFSQAGFERPREPSVASDQELDTADEAAGFAGDETGAMDEASYDSRTGPPPYQSQPARSSGSGGGGGGSGGGRGAPQAAPPPWECSETWTFEEMRTRLAAPNAAATTDDGVARLPLNVFGDLSSILEHSGVDSDEWGSLRRLLYSPRCTFNELCNKLNVSNATDFPRISQKALAAVLTQIDPKLSRKRARTLSMIGEDTVINVADIHATFVQLYGRDAMTARPKTVLERVCKLIVMQCGSLGLKVLRDKLDTLDVDGEGDVNMNPSQFKAALGRFNIHLNYREIEEVFHFFDRDRSGAVSFREFTEGLRGDMGQYRLDLVAEAWDQIAGGASFIDARDLEAQFDCTWYPSVESGRVRESDVVAAFVGSFTNARVDEDAFTDYYRDLSVGIEGDRLFEVIMRSTWHMS